MSKTRSNMRATCLTALLALALPGAWALPTINLTTADYLNSEYKPSDPIEDKYVTPTTSGIIANSFGAVTFKRDPTQPSGTGVFNPFLRLDCKGNGCDEQGYNTSATKTEVQGNTLTTRNILDNMMPVNWTHDVLINSLQLTGDGLFYQFKLDINEPGADKMSLLSLDGLKLFSTNTPSQSGELLETGSPNAGDIKDNQPGGTAGTKIWDMDIGLDGQYQDHSVLLDATVSGGPGSGIADMMMLVSADIIDKARDQGDQYLVLWSRFGLQQGAHADTSTTADAGFEEWAFMAKSGTVVNCRPEECPSGVPIPGTAYLAMLGLGILGWQRRGSSTAAVAH